MLLYPAPLRRKLRAIRAALLYPSLLLVIACAAVIALSWTGLAVSMFPESLQNAYIQAYMKSVVTSVPVYLLVPVMELFAALAFAGILLGMIVRKK
jgi:hypothetical protein